MASVLSPKFKGPSMISCLDAMIQIKSIVEVDRTRFCAEFKRDVLVLVPLPPAERLRVLTRQSVHIH